MPKRITRTARERDKEAVEIIRRLKGTPKKPLVLKANWTFEAVADLTQYGIDIEIKIMKALRTEIDKEMLRSLSGQGY